MDITNHLESSSYLNTLINVLAQELWDKLIASQWFSNVPCITYYCISLFGQNILLQELWVDLVLVTFHHLRYPGTVKKKEK